MADQSDVEAALVGVVSAALYPQGTDQASVVGSTCRIYRGWPNSAALDADLAADRINVTVFPVSGSGQMTTRWNDDWTSEGATSSLTVVLSDDDGSATFGGSVAGGELAGLLVDGRPYVYRTQAGDTPALVAAILADAVRADRVAWLHGATITVPGAGMFVARTVADAPARREVRRQRQTFRITAWCPTPEARDAAAASVDLTLAGTVFLPLSDGTVAHLRYAGSTTFDQSQNAALYRRDLLYAAEFATVLTASQPAMLFGGVAANGASHYA